MFNQFTDSYFWLSTPTLTLIPADKVLLYLFCAIVAVGITSWVFIYFNENKGFDVIAKKIRSSTLYIGSFGIFWFWLRYENIPVFANRYWAGALILLGLFLGVRILKFILIDFKQIKAEQEKEALKEKYLKR